MFQTLDLLQQTPPVNFELGLAGAAGTDTGTLLAELRAPTSQPRQAVAKLGELHLHAPSWLVVC